MPELNRGATNAPAVSVIVTTYNRPDVLRLALASALAQTFQDFEIVVVGDACTEATGEMVESIGDDRIRYHNLPENHGSQAEPSNAGYALSRGRSIAYLNHDDLWWPDHLEVATAALDERRADGVFTLLDSVSPDGGGVLLGVSPGGRYHPLAIAPASSWLLRRSLLDDIGGWRSAGELYNIPSQDLLFRAWKAGKRLHAVGELTVLACHSRSRPGVYVRPDVEVAGYWRRMQLDPQRLRIERLTALAESVTLRHEHASAPAAIGHGARIVLKRTAIAAGVHSMAAGKFIRHLRRGGCLDALQRQRGLTPTRRDIARPTSRRPT